MKGKDISKKIKRSLKVVDAYKKRADSVTVEAGNLLKKHVKIHDNAVELKDEIATLKTKLKSKKKEMNFLMKDLSKSHKTARKALKKSTKVTKRDKVFNHKTIRVVVPARKKRQTPTVKPKTGTKRVPETVE